jgi:hypothetical protein
MAKKVPVGGFRSSPGFGRVCDYFSFLDSTLGIPRLFVDTSHPRMTFGSSSSSQAIVGLGGVH